MGKSKPSKASEQRTVRVSRELVSELERIGAELSQEMGFRNPISTREIADMLLVKGIATWKRERASKG